MVGGLGRHVADITAHIAQHDVEIHLLTPVSGDVAAYEVIGGVHIHRVDVHEHAFDIVSRVAGAIPQFLRAAHRLWQAVGAFDIIHVHDWLLADVAIELKHTYQRPLIATVHAIERGRHRGDISSSESQVIDSIEWRLTYEAWRVIVCSHYMVQQLHHEFHVPLDKLDMIPNGVDIPVYPFADDQHRAEVRQRYQPHVAPLLFAVGRLVHEKGWHLLIRALGEVSHRFPEARLVLAGVGAYQAELHRVALDAGVDERVHFAGFISDTERNQLYAVADMAVFPSLYEPFGIVALEAMALRCPVVVSDTGGLREVVDLHRTGLLVESDSVASLVWGVHHILDHPTWSAQRVATAYDEVRQVYGWGTIATATVAVYRRVIAAWQGGSWGHWQVSGTPAREQS
jgi:glycosyltransferase involved in cell wall biosynthesis